MQDISFWDSCLRSLKKSLPPQQFNSWIKPLDLRNEDGTLVLTAPNSFTLKLVQERFLPEIYRQAGLALSQVPSFQFRVMETPPASRAPDPEPPTRKNASPEPKTKIEPSFRG